MTIENQSPSPHKFQGLNWSSWAIKTLEKLQL